MERVAQLWNGLFRAVMEAPSLEVLKNQVDVAPGDVA